MSWFRANRGVAAWLALFALACQLAFSFGHVHLGSFGVSGLNVAKFSIGLAARGAAPAADSAAGTPPPPQRDPARPGDDFCAVCANISLAGALILPVLALILAPGSFTYVLRWSLAASAPALFGHQSFTARGPPHV
jgi:hypothetical protein